MFLKFFSSGTIRYCLFIDHIKLYTLDDEIIEEFINFEGGVHIV